MVMSDGLKTLNGDFTGALYRPSGPAFSAQPWIRPALTQVGNLTLSFAHGDSATLTYTVNGVAVTRQIQRYVFGMPKTLCEP